MSNSMFDSFTVRNNSIDALNPAMGRSSIMDAFNAAAGVVNQATGYYTNKLREKNEFDLRKDDYDAQIIINDWIRDNPYNGSNNEEGDEQAYNEYLTRLNFIIDKSYSEAGSGNRSANYRQQLEQRRQLARSAAKNVALGKSDEFRINREWNSLENDTKRYLDLVKSGGWSPQQALEAVNNRIELSKTRVEIKPEQYNKMLNSAEIAVFQIYSQNAADRCNDVNFIDAAMNEVTNAFKFMKPVTVNVYNSDGKLIKLEDIESELEELNAKKESGELLSEDEQRRFDELNESLLNPVSEEHPWSFSGQDEWLDALKEKTKARIHGERFADMSDRDARVQRLIIAGDLAGAIREAKEGRKILDRYYNPNDREFVNYNREYRDRSSHFFKVGEYEGYQKQGSDGEKALQLSFHWRDVFNAAIHGNQFLMGGRAYTFTDIEDAVDKVMLISKTAYLHNNDNPLAEETWRREAAKEMNGFYDQFRNFLTDTNPDLLKSWDRYRAAETYLDKKSEYYHENFELDRGQSAISYFTNLIFKQGITDTAKLEDEMKRYTGKILLENIVRPRTTNNERSRIIRDAELTRFLESSDADDLMHIDVNLERDGIKGDGRSQSVYFRNKEHEQVINELAERQRFRAADILKCNLDNFTIEWMESTKRKDDVQPRAFLRFIPTGELLKIDYEGGRNNDEREVLKKYNESTKRWVPVGERERPLNQAEQGQQRVREINEVQNVTKTGMNPINGERIDITTAPPNSTVGSDTWRAQQTSVLNRDTGRWEIDASRGWAEYYIELKKNPALTVEEVVNKGRNPITGQQMEFDKAPVPGFTGQYTDWQGKPYSEKIKLWSDYFTRQVINAGR